MVSYLDRRLLAILTSNILPIIPEQPGVIREEVYP